ncbi:MAG: FAD-dependent oxidoreductase [Candidatus Njordarchaeia archaeon]
MTRNNDTRDLRISKYDETIVNRDKEVYFFFEKRKIKGYEGEPIAVALWANGIRFLQESLKYHRPRGVQHFRPTWEITHVIVDGIPHVNPVVEKVREGTRVEIQGKRNRLLAAFMEKIDTSPTRYYIELAKPRLIRKMLTSMTNMLLGHPKVPIIDNKTIKPREPITMETDVVILGASLSALYLAKFLGEHNVKVYLISDEEFFGGSQYYREHEVKVEEKKTVKSKELVKTLVDEISRMDTINLIKNADIIGLHEDKSVGIIAHYENVERYIVLKPRIVVSAMDPVERTPLFYNNDLPGILFVDSAFRLLNIYGVKPGEKVLIVGGGFSGLALAHQLVENSINVVGIVDRGDINGEVLSPPADIEIYQGYTIYRAVGEKNVETVEIVRATERNLELGEPRISIDCDTIILATGFRPFHELPYQLKPLMRYVEELDGFVVLRDKYFETTVEGLYVIGDIVKFWDAQLPSRIAKTAGLDILRKLGVWVENQDKLIVEAEKETHRTIEKVGLKPIYDKIWR